jgi:hypothetical protein
VGPFLPVGGWIGPKYDHFWGQNQAFMAGWFQGENHTWKWFNEPFHTQMHVTALFRTIFALPRHLSRGTGAQKWLFLWLKKTKMADWHQDEIHT